MGAKLKTKRKSAHTDAYSGGQASGKKAKKDARIPLEWMVIRYIAPLPPPSQTSYANNHPIPPSSNHIPYSPNTYGHPLSTTMDYTTPNMTYNHSHYPSHNPTAISALPTYSSSPYTSSNHSGQLLIPSTPHRISIDNPFNPYLAPHPWFSSHNTSNNTYLP